MDDNYVAQLKGSIKWLRRNPIRNKSRVGKTYTNDSMLDVKYHLVICSGSFSVPFPHTSLALSPSYELKIQST